MITFHNERNAGVVEGWGSEKNDGKADDVFSIGHIKHPGLAPIDRGILVD